MIKNADLAKEIEELRVFLGKGLPDKNSVIITELKKNISDTSKRRFSILRIYAPEIMKSMSFVNQQMFEGLNCESVLDQNSEPKKCNQELTEANNSLGLQFPAWLVFQN